MGKRARAAALILAVAALLSACSHDIGLKEISADLIPEEYVDSLRSVIDHVVPGSIVWRVCQDLGDYTLVACTYEVFYEGAKYPAYAVWARGNEGEWATEARAGCVRIPRFGAIISEKWSAGRITHLDLAGTAMDERIKKVRVVTRGDTAAETEPFDGFWVIPFGVAVDHEFVDEVLALDNDGKVLYREKAWHMQR